MWRHFAGRDFPLEGFWERLFPAEGFELGGISPHSQLSLCNLGYHAVSTISDNHKYDEFIRYFQHI